MANIEILFENNDILAINKPAGLVVHPDGRTSGEPLCDWILERYPEIRGVGEPLVIKREGRDPIVIDRPGIVHRLDKDTSGGLLIAKTSAGFSHLKALFQNREVKKMYHAFVWGEIPSNPDKEMVINLPIARSRSDFRRWSAERGARGKSREAVTRYRVVPHRNGFSFVEVRPETGRTHQIRVHFKAMSHPIVGDALYAPKRPLALGLTRLGLHAFSLELLGLFGEEIRVVAPDPKEFGEALNVLKV